MPFGRTRPRRRYANWRELLDYCRYSAMPVGRHVLDLHGEASCDLRALRRTVRRAADPEPFAGLRRRSGNAGPVLHPGRPAGGSRPGRDGCCGPTPLPLGCAEVLDQLLTETQTLNRIGEGTAVPWCGTAGLRVETAVIVGLAERLTRRLRREDPLAQRVKLRRGDVVGSVLLALPWLR